MVCACLGACSTVETQSFIVAKNSNVESAQISADADFSQYDKLMSGGFGIYFPPEAAPPQEDLNRLREAFATAFRAQLQGYTVVEEPGPGVMQVDSSLIDLRNAGAAAIPDLRRDINEIAQSGNLVFLMEMKDSQSGHVLARAGDSARTPAFAISPGSETDWTSVEEAAQYWAQLFRTFLDENLGR